jgi:hypothetical protein
VPRHNPVSELYGQFVRPRGLVFYLCVPFKIMSNHLILPQVDDNQGEETSVG